MGKLKNDKWVRLVIFYFRAELNYGWTRIDTDSEEEEEKTFTQISRMEKNAFFKVGITWNWLE